MNHMYDPNMIGLCCGSLIQADFRGLVEAAAKAGFCSISLWPSLFYNALESGLTENDMISILDDNGLRVTELDPYCSWLPITVDPTDMAASFYAYEASDFFRIADALGGRTLNVIQLSDTPISDNERVELLASLCERAQQHNLIVSVEFLPWSPIANIQQALELVQATGKSNCGVNIDIWHHFRSGGTIEQLASLDPTLVAAIQFNDVAAEPWDNILEETSTGRLLPGEGCSNSVAVLKALYQAGVQCPINVEVFSEELMQLPAAEAAQKMADSMRSVLAQTSSVCLE